MNDFCKTLEAGINAVQPDVKEQQVLRDLAQKCLYVSQKLQKELSHKGKSGIIGKVLKARLRKAAIERDSAELARLQQSVQTEILGHLWIRNQAARVEQQDSFKDLDHQLQQFIKMVAAGYTQLEELIQREASATRTHTSAEGAKLGHLIVGESSKITDRIDQERELHEQRSRIAKFLKSLTFPEMNA